MNIPKYIKEHHAYTNRTSHVCHENIENKKHENETKNMLV